MPANLFPTDPDENAASLSNLAEVLFGCLDAIAARTVVEVGAFHGKSTNEMLAWAERAGAKVIAVDPAPQPDLTEIAAGHPELALVEATSHDALPKLPVADAIIIDGDHNYFTLSEELRLISKRDTGATMPLLMLHDIGWPLARRDGYYAPDRIPAEHRQPLAFNTFLAPEEPGTLDEGMPFACVAEREGGPANGILTAVEDFLSLPAGARVREGAGVFRLRRHLASPTLHWAAAVAAAVAPWDCNPVLERLEANRVRHMVARYRMTRRLEIATDRLEQADAVLRALEGSRAFAVAEQLSRAHRRGRPAFTREDVRRALNGG